MTRSRKYEVPTTDELDYAAGYADRLENGFTGLQIHFADWVASKCQPNFNTQKENDAFLLGASAALWLRMYHQRSPENHVFKAENDETREADAVERADAREAKKAARAEKAAQAEADKTERQAQRDAVKAGKSKAPATTGRKPGRPPGSGKSKPATGAARPARRPAAAGRPGRPARGGEAAF